MWSLSTFSSVLKTESYEDAAKKKKKHYKMALDEKENSILGSDV